jgi:hypothetical protein
MALFGSLIYPLAATSDEMIVLGFPAALGAGAARLLF